MARWDNAGIPHKGWTLVECIDLGADASDDEIEYETCEMCHNERIRYVHILTHPDYPGEIRVGCDCACKMTEDYISHPENERRLKNRATRRRNFIKQEWVRNYKGNLVLRYKGEHITAIERNGFFRFVYHGEWVQHYKGRKIADLNTLKLAAFETFDTNG